MTYLATNRRYMRPKWIVRLERKLVQLMHGEILRLIVMVPPRHGKSTLISHGTPVWWLGNNPDDQVILCSYAADFAARWGEKAKTSMYEWGQQVFDGLTVDPEHAQRSDWGLAGHAGGMLTAGVGGPITGRGANLFIIDDPIKNAEEAQSEVYREKTWEWFLSTAYTRLEPNARMIIIMTRWHEDDLVGRLLGDASDEVVELDEHWDVINFPALAEEHDELGRDPGDALFPERYPKERLERIEQRIGPYWFAALYQQRPAPLEGGIFKREWFRFFTEDGNYAWVLKTPSGPKPVPKNTCWYITTVDPAWTEKTTADYTVIQTWAITPDGEMLLADQIRRQMPAEELIPALQSVMARWMPSIIGIEAGGGGQSYLATQVYRAGIPVIELKPDRDKVLRAQALVVKASHGDVYLPEGISWVPTLIHELLTFPNAAHDDQVDAAAYAAAQLIDRGGDAFVVRNFVK